MKKFKSLIAAFVVTLLSAAFILPIAACNNDENADGDNAVYVTSLGGMALQDVTVELFKDNTSLGLKKTNEEGKLTYNLNNGTDYTVKLSDLPDGFLPEGSYTVKGDDTTTYIRVNSQVIESGTPKRVYKRGDVMYDFAETYYTYRDGKMQTLENKKLSDFFKEGKKFVMIDFFYNGCSACNNEYNALSGAYKKYADKMEILGINDYPDNYNGETPADLQAKVQSEQVPFLMCKDRAGESTWFNGIKTGYPTAIMIDRYGIMCDYMVGNNTDQSFWETLFETYTSDDYSQSVNPGDDPDTFVPDVPDDFGATMPDSATLNGNANINNTGKNIQFGSANSNTSSGWPWDLTEDGTALYPTNSGHRGTFAVMYAQIDLAAGDVLAFDYKLSTNDQNDYLYVSLDSRLGTGRQISMQSGIHDWQTGYAYVALESGRHEIEFTYYRSTANATVPVDDKAYIKNLRITTVEEMNEYLTAKQETLEIPYFAARNYNNRTKQYDYDNVYVASDGYYHIGTKDAASANDPYLFLDLTHSIPYFNNNSSSLFTLYSSKVSSGGFIINGLDYSVKFQSLISFSSNSLYSGMIPVTEEIEEIITLLYNDTISADKSYWSEKGWLQFCVSYRQYGVQKALTDPIKGLAYFSAFEAKETTREASYIATEVGEGKFYMDPEETEGLYVDVEETDWATKGNYNLNPAINEVHFDRIIMPLGMVYKFVPEKSGVYNIHGLDCYYRTASELDVIDAEETDATLYDGSLDISHAFAQPLAASDSDRYDRNGMSNSFKIYYYLEEGETYYISVSFRVVETTGDFAFRIDYIDETYSYINQAAANYYLPDDNGKLKLPLYCEPAFDDSHTYNFNGTVENVWYDKKTGGKIYLDFTKASSMFDRFTIEKILDPAEKTAQYTFDISAKSYTDPNGTTYDITLDLVKRYGSVDKIPDVLKGLDTEKDYTVRMREYLEMATAVDKDDPYYGLLPVNQELFDIIQLYNAKFWGYDSDDEWLRACCYTVNLGPNN